jgi:hypothetical protein
MENLRKLSVYKLNLIYDKNYNQILQRDMKLLTLFMSFNY